MTFLNSARRSLRNAGLDVRRFPSQMEDYLPLTTFLRDVERVIDVGAAQGQFGKKCRSYGFRGELISFEPLEKSYKQLVYVSSRDIHWTAWKLALSSREGEAELRIASNEGHSSSLNEMLPSHTLGAPEVKVVGTEKVAVTTLDRFLFSNPETKALGRFALKIDAQGEELNVLSGAEETLARCYSVLLEMSLTPLYLGSSNWQDLISYLESRGFTMVGLIPGFTSSSGELLQFDGVFRRRSG
jgi:FkbM family methyltransferase